MREVHSAVDLREQLAGARREAQASFGDATVFLERLIQQPRHVEIQALGDTFGNLVHLCERECSIQRRHQKKVEASPSVALTPALSAQMRTATATRPAIRVDSGIESCDEFTQFYDPMIAKLIVYSEDRTSAIERLQAALKQEVVFGVKTNSPLLLAIAKHPAFRQGRTYTSFLEESEFLGDKVLVTHPGRPKPI